MIHSWLVPMAALLILVVACGGDGEDLGELIEVTSTAQSFVAPTTERLLQDSSAPVWELLGLTSIREVPVALERESPRLPPNEVTELWNQFVGGIREADNVTGRQFFEFCSDGTGRYLDWWTPELSLLPEGLAGETFTWRVFKDPGGAWNTGKLEITLDDPTLDPVLSSTNFAFARQNGEWVGVYAGIEFVIFDSPDCD